MVIIFIESLSHLTRYIMVATMIKLHSCYTN